MVVNSFNQKTWFVKVKVFMPSGIILELVFNITRSYNFLNICIFPITLMKILANWQNFCSSFPIISHLLVLSKKILRYLCIVALDDGLLGELRKVNLLIHKIQKLFSDLLLLNLTVFCNFVYPQSNQQL